MTEPKPQYQTNEILPTVRPSPRIEPIIRQLQGAIVEVYKADGVRVKVVIVEKS